MKTLQKNSKNANLPPPSICSCRMDRSSGGTNGLFDDDDDGEWSGDFRGIKSPELPLLLWMFRKPMRGLRPASVWPDSLFVALVSLCVTRALVARKSMTSTSDGPLSTEGPSSVAFAFVRRMDLDGLRRFLGPGARLNWKYVLFYWQTINWVTGSISK